MVNTAVYTVYWYCGGGVDPKIEVSGLRSKLHQDVTDELADQQLSYRLATPASVSTESVILRWYDRHDRS